MDMNWRFCGPDCPGNPFEWSWRHEQSREQSRAKNTLAEWIREHLPHPGNADLTLKVRSWEL